MLISCTLFGLESPFQLYYEDVRCLDLLVVGLCFLYGVVEVFTDVIKKHLIILVDNPRYHKRDHCF